MKIKEIELSDWRCYPGRQKVMFSTDHNKPLTTIWGTNGSGKTTVLNAILWAMWNEFSADFQENAALVNKTKLSQTNVGETAESYVEIKFEHRKSKFTLRRTYCERRNADDSVEKVSDSTKLVEIDETGESYVRQDSIAFAYIDEILPKLLAKYFFFNGEHFVTSLRDTAGKKEFGRSVQRVLGLTKYDRALKHCDEGLKRLLGDVGQFEDDAQLNSLLIDKHDRDQLLESLLSRELDFKRQIDLSRERVAEIDALLQKFEHISEKIKRRKEIDDRLIPAREKTLSAKSDDLRVLIARNYALLVLKEHTKEIAELSEKHREQKHIPAGFKQAFIADLLTSGTCICGCALVDGQPNYLQVSARLQEGAVSGTEEEWTILGIGIDRVGAHLELFDKSFNEIMSAIQVETQSISELADEREALSREILEANSSENIVDQILNLEKERSEVRANIDNFMKQTGEFDFRILLIKEEIKELAREIAAVIPKNDAAKLARKQLEYLQEVRNQLAAELADLRIRKRSELQDRTTLIFRSLSNLSFFVELDDDFVVKMCDYSERSVSIERAMGTGDTLMMYYSFVAALSKMSLNANGDEGGNQTFPLMIDAPFSPLDESQRIRVAEMLPDFTHQIAFFMLKSHLTITDSKAVDEKIGRIAVIKFNGSAGVSLIEESIEAKGKVVPYTKNGTEKHHSSEIAQVL